MWKGKCDAACGACTRRPYLQRLTRKRRLSAWRSGLFTVLAGLAATSAAAQERPGATAEFVAGWVGFADDGVVSEPVVGGSARWYATPRIAIGPEALYMAGDGHSHFVLTGNLTFDLLPPGRAATPFVIAGGGLFQTRETFLTGTFTSTEGAFTAGGGVRARAGERVTVGVDARVGWELHLRVNALVGWRFGS